MYSVLNGDVERRNAFEDASAGERQGDIGQLLSESKIALPPMPYEVDEQEEAW